MCLINMHRFFILFNVACIGISIYFIAQGSVLVWSCMIGVHIIGLLSNAAALRAWQS